MKKQVLFFAVLTLNVITLSIFTLGAQPILPGTQAPDFSLKNIDGTTGSLSDYSEE